MSHNMTYADLAQEIAKMPLEQRMQTVTMFVPGVDEYFPCTTAVTDEDNDVLDPNHVVLVPCSDVDEI